MFCFQGILLNYFQVQKCTALATYLHLPALQGVPNLRQRREQIANYLGVVL
jgi:hypothetical protein